MDREALIERLMATFLAELEDHVASLNRDLLALEREPSPAAREALLRGLFRTAHSLKGAARSVDVGLIEAACHALEELLARTKGGGPPLGRDGFERMFAAADALQEAGARLRERKSLSGSPLEELLPQLLSLAEALRPAPLMPSPVPRVAPTPVPRATPTPRPSPVQRASPTPVPTPVPPPPPVPKPTPVPPPSPLSSPSPSLSPPPVAPSHVVPLASQSPVVTPGSSSSARRHAGSLRVSTEKLDALLLRSAELLVASQRIAALREPIEAVHQIIASGRAERRAPQLSMERSDHADAGDGAADAASPSGLHPSAAAHLRRASVDLAALEGAIERISRAVAMDSRLLGQLVRALEEDVRRARMLPFSEACQGLARLARDLGGPAGKEITLEIEGGEVEVDRALLDGLRDPIVHLVRNAVDHGVEPAADRLHQGKPRAARVTIACAVRGGQVEVTVADDGRGIDPDAIRRAARAKGLPAPDDARELASLLFLPGFSTSRAVTSLSGRGVGLDVVKTCVESLHGAVNLTSEPGQGARFSLAVPLTLTTLRALLVSAGGSLFALPSPTIRRLLRVGPGDLRAIEGREVVFVDGAAVPVMSLAGALGMPATAEARGEAGHKLSAVVVSSGGAEAAFVVDELLAEQEIIVKGLGRRVPRVPRVTGATVLPSGRIALILGAAEILHAALFRGAGGAALAAPLFELSLNPAQASRRRLLIADDSITTRSLEKTILESAGYEVIAAADGVEALRLLEESDVHLVVSDVDMPRMDGFALTEAIRASPRLRDLPVILLSARGSDSDKARGAEAGADAYLVKSAFEQKSLLEAISQLL